MYLNPIWSGMLLGAIVALYVFVIRPRLKVAFTETYQNIDNWWMRQWARIVAFRSYVATAIAGALIALPDLAVAILPIDLSSIVGPKWAPTITALLTIFLAVNRAFATKPGEEK